MLPAVVCAAIVSSANAFNAAPSVLFHGGRLYGTARIARDGPRFSKGAAGLRARPGATAVARLEAKVGAESIMCPTPLTVRSKVPTFYPRTKRVVALGDVHGDSYALSTVLRDAGLIDEVGAWVGGDAMLVQVGDVLDRGPDEAVCLMLLMRLQKEARAAGGDVVTLLGNHEVMNSDLDYRYVDPLGWLGWDEESDQVLAAQMANSVMGKKTKKGAKPQQPNWQKLLERAQTIAEEVGRPAVRVLPAFMQGRIKALGGREGALANSPVAVTVGSTVFCHAGLMPEVVAYGLQRLNDETSAYLTGRSKQKPFVLDSIPQISPIWHRAFGSDSLEFDQRALAAADGAMRLLGAKRMVIGHTPQQQGINCVRTPEGREIWRVDTGMSQGIAQGPLESLEMACEGGGEEDTEVHILKGGSRVPAAKRTVQGGEEKEMTLEKELQLLRLTQSSNKSKDASPHLMRQAMMGQMRPDTILSVQSSGRGHFLRPRVEV
jgi:hypothetical protein